MVCVSHTYQFVYLKTHKTASTSAEMALEPYCAPPGHVPHQNLRDMVISEYGVIGARAAGREVREQNKAWFMFHHMHATRVRRNIGTLYFDRYKKVACVRNPFKRLLSQFIFQHDVKNLPLPETLDEARVAFKEAFPPPGQLKVYRKDRPGEVFVRLASDFGIVSVDGELVLDHYLRTEKLEEDLTTFLEAQGAPVDGLVIPHQRDNKRQYRNWTVMDFFDDDEMVDLAIQLDGWVFDLVGYSKDPRDA